MQNNVQYFWPRVWLLLSGLHPLIIGILLFWREFFFSSLNMSLPSPPLYGNIASAFLITIGIWLSWTAYKMPNSPELWVIPAGSAIGRIIYFGMSLLGFLNGENELIYVLLGLSDIFFSIILIWIVLAMRRINNN